MRSKIIILYFLCLFTSITIFPMEKKKNRKEYQAYQATIILEKRSEEPAQEKLVPEDYDRSRRKKVFNQDPALDTFLLMQQMQDCIELLDKKSSELNEAKSRIVQLEKQVRLMNSLLKKNQKFIEE